MPLVLFLLFLAVPLAELWLILQVGTLIGGWWTLLLLVLDSLAGAFIVRREGARAWRAFREALQAGRWPGDEVAQGALILGGGALLLTPGFLTDAVGLLAVLPPTRALLARVVRARFGGAVRVVGGPPPGRRRDGHDAGPGPDRSGQASSDVLDVEVVSVERDEPDELDRP